MDDHYLLQETLKDLDRETFRFSVVEPWRKLAASSAGVLIIISIVVAVLG